MGCLPTRKRVLPPVDRGAKVMHLALVEDAGGLHGRCKRPAYGNGGSIPSLGTMNINSTPHTIVPLRRDFHVVPRGHMWVVKEEHRVNPIGWHFTKVEAIAEGIKQARDGYVSLIIHGKDGRIQRVYSYDDWVWPHD